MVGILLSPYSRTENIAGFQRTLTLISSLLQASQKNRQKKKARLEECSVKSFNKDQLCSFPLQDLPEELLQKIVETLSLKDIENLSCSSNVLRRQCRSPSLWKHLCARDLAITEDGSRDMYMSVKKSTFSAEFIDSNVRMSGKGTKVNCGKTVIFDKVNKNCWRFTNPGLPTSRLDFEFDLDVVPRQGFELCLSHMSSYAVGENEFQAYLDISLNNGKISSWHHPPENKFTGEVINLPSDFLRQGKNKLTIYYLAESWSLYSLRSIKINPLL